jgi:hypothetical protein
MKDCPFCAGSGKTYVEGEPLPAKSPHVRRHKRAPVQAAVHSERHAGFLVPEEPVAALESDYAPIIVAEAAVAASLLSGESSSCS